MSDSGLYIGIDLGTSGCRAIAIDRQGAIAGEARIDLPPPRDNGGGAEQDPQLWWRGVEQVLLQLLRTVSPDRIHAVAVDGTSGTVVLTDASGTPCAPALMYNDDRAIAEARAIAALAPPASAAHGTGSGLAKLLWLLEHDTRCGVRVATQADWVAARLTGCPGISDANNVLKLGWDPVAATWPGWLQALGVRPEMLPQVVPPGTALGPIRDELADRWGLSRDTLIVAGTTDSTAAILATGASQTADAVTSLGSTLVTKVVAEQPVFAPEYGVYSQPFGDKWLVGGGSNSGGAVLKAFFTPERMAELSGQLDPDRPTGLDYYPLLRPGERFPINDPNHPPRLTPRPDDDARFFQGLLEGIAAIETAAYHKLAELGAPFPQRVYSAGGGAANSAWSRIRERLLGVPLASAVHTEAAYGTAILARKAAA